MYPCTSVLLFPVTITQSPVSMNSTCNSTVTLSCAATNAEVIIWYLNDSYIKKIPGVDFDTKLDEDVTPPVSYLYIYLHSNATKLDHSSIFCRALKFSKVPGSPVADSDTALLLVQGTFSLFNTNHARLYM